MEICKLKMHMYYKVYPSLNCVILGIPRLVETGVQRNIVRSLSLNVMYIDFL